jgi:hypothetical protein
MRHGSGREKRMQRISLLRSQRGESSQLAAKLQGAFSVRSARLTRFGARRNGSVMNAGSVRRRVVETRRANSISATGEA